MRIVHILRLQHFKISIKYADNIQLRVYMWELALEFSKCGVEYRFKKSDRVDADINYCQNGRYM